MPCVFISHSSLDRDIVAREIISPLRAHGVDTWYSTDDIQTASDWERQILQGLMTCDWFLVALTPRAVESEWVRREVHWAIMKRKNKVVPVMLETCEPEDLHLGLLPIQYIDFRGGGDRELERLLAVWGLDKGTQVKNLYQAARDAISNEDWASAVENLEAVQRLDPTHSQARTDLDRVRQQEYLASLYEEGLTAIREQSWRDALETLGRLREASKVYKDVEELIAVARAELEKAERLYDEATETVGRGEWAAAVEQFQAVLDITPAHAGAQAGLGRALQQKELAELYTAGHTHLEAGRWNEALKMFRRVRSIDRSYKGVAELIADADAGLAEEEQSRTSAEEQESFPAVGANGRAKKYGLGKDLALMLGVIVLIIVVLALRPKPQTSQDMIPATPTPDPQVTPTPDPQVTPTPDPQVTPTPDRLRKKSKRDINPNPRQRNPQPLDQGTPNRND
jgi:outer membrane protein assembly factor BamD (BamD/ComL family)